MALYEYVCKECEHKFTHRQSINDDSLPECPECGGEVKRIISGGSGFILKGSGFYETDYKSKTPNQCGTGGCDDPKRCCET